MQRPALIWIEINDQADRGVGREEGKLKYFFCYDYWQLLTFDFLLKIVDLKRAIEDDTMISIRVHQETEIIHVDQEVEKNMMTNIRKDQETEAERSIRREDLGRFDFNRLILIC